MVEKDIEYKVVLAKVPCKGGYLDRYIVIKNQVPLYEISKWLEAKSVESTNKKYANVIISYLKYLQIIGMKYRDVTERKVIDLYIDYLLHGTLGYGGVTDIIANKTYKSTMDYVNRIKQFYKWLDNEIEIGNKYRFIWDSDFRDRISKKRFKPNKDYIKWYSQEQSDKLSSSFKTIRDKIIYLISLEVGCRISEILYIRYSDYDGIEQTIEITESKTAQRSLPISQELCSEIDRYINTERKDVEADIGLLEYLFVNLRKDKYLGERVTYGNYRRILQSASERIGFDKNKIRTHSGRSTMAQSLVEKQILNPEIGITDSFICDFLGWSSIQSLKPYKDQPSIKVKKEIMKKSKLKGRMK